MNKGHRIQVRKGASHTLVWYPPEGRVPDGDVSVTAYSAGDSEMPTSGSWPETLTPDSTSGAIQASADINSREIEVDSVSGFVRRRRYLVLDQYGDAQATGLVGIDPSNNKLRLSDPIRNALVSGDTIRGYAVELTLDTQFTATRRRGVRLEWSYSLDGDSVGPHIDYLDVVRRPFNVPLDEGYMVAFDHAWAQRRPTNAREFLDDVVQIHVYNALDSAGFEPDLVRVPSRLRPYAASLAEERLELIRIKGGKGSMEVYTELRKATEEEWHKLIADPDIWYDYNDDETGFAGPPSTFADGGNWEPYRAPVADVVERPEEGLFITPDPIG